MFCVMKYKIGIIFSTSSDTTIRMWNIETMTTIAIFGGLAGHEDMVLSIDISVDGDYIVSSGTDNSIKIWKIPDKNCKYKDRNMEFPLENYYIMNNKYNSKYIPIMINFPVFASQVLHKAYITCVRFFGNTVISKNIGNRLTIIKFIGEYQIYKNSIDSDAIILKEYKFSSKLIHKFTIYGSKLIVFDELGNCFMIDLLSYSEPVFEMQVINVKDAALVNNSLFVVCNNNTIFCYTIN